MGREIIVGYRDKNNNFVDIDFICGRTDFTNRLFNFFDYHCNLDECQVFELTNDSTLFDTASKDITVDDENQKVMYISAETLKDIIKENEAISNQDIATFERKIDRAYKVLDNASTLKDLLDLEDYIDKLKQEESDAVDYTPIAFHKYINIATIKYGNIIICWSE